MIKTPILFALAALTSLGLCLAQTPVFQKSVLLDGTVDSTYGTSLSRLTGQNGIVVRGTFSDSLVIEGSRLASRGLADGFLCSANDDLSLNWMAQFGGPGYDAITCMAPLPDGGIVVGMLCGASVDGITSYRIGDVTFSGRGGADAVVFVVNADGSVRWARNDGAVNAEYPTAIAVTDDSLIIVAGIFLRDSRFGSDVVKDSSEIAGYVQAIDFSGRHKWVRVIRGRGFDDIHTAVRLLPLHLNASASGNIDVVVSSTEMLAWADTVINSEQSQLYGTTAVLRTNSAGDAVDADAAVVCPAAQSIYFSDGGIVGIVSAETIANACTTLPFDVIALKPDALGIYARRLDVNSPVVRSLRSTTHGHVVSGATESRAMLLGLTPNGSIRWVYVHKATDAAMMHDAIESDSSIIAVELSGKASLIRLGITTSIDVDTSDRGFNDSPRSDDKKVYENQIVGHDELQRLLGDGYALTLMTGVTFDGTAPYAFGVRTLASQPLIITHASHSPRFVLLAR